MSKEIFYLSGQAAVIDEQSVAIVGGRGVLPCNTSAPSSTNPPTLVIWYKQGSTDPVYSYDLRASTRATSKARNTDSKGARHWADAHALRGRATFHMAPPGAVAKGKKSFLSIRNVIDMDRGLFRCRVDFKGAPTRNSRVNLTVIGKHPKKIIDNYSFCFYECK